MLDPMTVVRPNPKPLVKNLSYRLVTSFSYENKAFEHICGLAGAWATEILEVLAPLVINCREAAEQLVTLGGLQALSALVHHPAEEPLPLSLMLDMVEALVALGDDCVQAEVRQMLVRDGLLQPVLQALRLPGLNRKSVAILSHMAKVCRFRVGHRLIVFRCILHDSCRCPHVRGPNILNSVDFHV